MSNAPDAPDALGEPDPAPSATNPRLLTRRFNDFMRYVLDQREARGGAGHRKRAKPVCESSRARGVRRETPRRDHARRHRILACRNVRESRERYARRSQRSRQRRSAGRCHCCPSIFCCWTEQLGLIDNNPFHGLHVTKLLRPDEDEDDDDLTYLTYEEQQALASCADISEPDRLAILFAIGTGLTQSEQFNLRLEDLRLTDANPHVKVRVGTDGRKLGESRQRDVHLLGQVSPPLADGSSSFRLFPTILRSCCSQRRAAHRAVSASRLAATDRWRSRYAKQGSRNP